MYGAALFVNQALVLKIRQGAAYGFGGHACHLGQVFAGDLKLVAVIARLFV